MLPMATTTMPSAVERRPRRPSAHRVFATSSGAGGEDHDHAGGDAPVVADDEVPPEAREAASTKRIYATSRARAARAA